MKISYLKMFNYGVVFGSGLIVGNLLYQASLTVGKLAIIGILGIGG